MGAWRARQTGTQPGGEVSDQFGFISEAGQFQGAKRNESWPCSRLLPMPWPGEASRPYCLSSATGGASRRIAVACPRATTRGLLLSGRYAEHRGLWNLWDATDVFDCLGILRPTERSGTELKPAKMECNGEDRAESVESVIGCGRNRADIWRRRADGRPGARPRQASSTSVGSVTLGCRDQKKSPDNS